MSPLKKLTMGFLLFIASASALAQVFPFPPRRMNLYSVGNQQAGSSCSTGVQVKFNQVGQNKFQVEIADFLLGPCPQYNVRTTVYKDPRVYFVNLDGIDSCGSIHYSGQRTNINPKYTTYIQMIDQRNAKSSQCLRNLPSKIILLETDAYGRQHSYHLPPHLMAK